MDLLIVLDRDGGRPLRDQLYAGLRAAILDGRLRPGAKLTATRAMASQLGISRFTVEDAFARLVAEGYATGRRGSGTYVSAGTGVDTPRSTAAAPDPVPGSRPATPPAPSLSAWGTRVDALREEIIGSIAVRPSLPYDFRHAMPAWDAFPHALWRRVQNREANAAGIADRSYGPAAGEPALRAAVAAYLARSRGVGAAGDPGRVVVTGGAQQALDLLARLWLDPGDVVAMEDPGYPAARRVFRAAGATVCPIPVDADGMRVDLLDDRAPAAKLVYVTPSHQYPTGGVLPLGRRLALLAWARRRNALIVEDDYDGEFRYGARPLPALAGLDTGPDPALVAYVGTFSKVLYPALRLGSVALPPALVGPFVAALAVADRHPPTADQAALAAFIEAGHFARHLARMRRLYAERRAALTGALTAHLPGIAHRDPATTAAGLHLLVGFETPLTETELVARAADAGIHLDPAGPCFVDPPARPSVLLGYAPMPEAAIRDGIERLAAVLDAGG